MRVYRALQDLPDPAPRAALTIGNFDGVHAGHQAILHELHRQARDRQALTSVLTFEPHPQAVLRGHAPLALATPERKLALLEEAGVDQLVILPFDRTLSMVEPEAFVDQLLVGRLRTQAMVVGSNFRFGHKARGDVVLLSSLGTELGFAFETVGVSQLDGRPVSSTGIRTAVATCDVEWAARALTRPHRVPGRIVRGRGRGVGLGFPTANLEPPDNFCLPGLGIYAGYLQVGDQRLVSAISVGTNPTFGSDNPISIEAYALDFSGDLYGEVGEIDFVAWLRAEAEFPTSAALAAAIESDVARVRALLMPESP